MTFPEGKREKVGPAASVTSKRTRQAKFQKVILSAFLSMEAKSFKQATQNKCTWAWCCGRHVTAARRPGLRSGFGGGRLFLLLYWPFWNCDVQRLAVLLRSMQHAEAHTFIQPCMWWHTMSGHMMIFSFTSHVHDSLLTVPQWLWCDRWEF